MGLDLRRESINDPHPFGGAGKWLRRRDGKETVPTK
jgi:hypothetical protein